MDLLVSAAAGGLAVLAKIPGWISAPTIGLLALSAAFWWGETRRAEQGGVKTKLLHGLLIPLLLWGTGFVIVITIFFPAIWTQPVNTFRGLVRSPFSFAEQVVTAEPDESLDESASQKPNSTGATTPFSKTQPEPEPTTQQTPGPIFADRFIGYIARYPRGYFESASPVTLIGLLFAFAAYLLRAKLFIDVKIRRSVAGLFLFTVLYTLFMTVPPKSSGKYYAPVYPVFSLIAGTGLVAATRWLEDRLQPSWKGRISSALIAGALLIQAAQSILAHPYFLTYTNPLAGNPDKYAWGSGEGLDLAAEYLNQKPGVESMRVMSWYGIGPFSYYFKGKTIPILLGETEWGEGRIQQLANTDYLVTYANQWRRDFPPGLNEFLAGLEPEKRIWINLAEYARIYAVKQIHPSRFVIPGNLSP